MLAALVPPAFLALPAPKMVAGLSTDVRAMDFLLSLSFSPLRTRFEVWPANWAGSYFEPGYPRISMLILAVWGLQVLCLLSS